jgi:RNase P/RNase MRP subunit p29
LSRGDRRWDIERVTPALFWAASFFTLPFTRPGVTGKAPIPFYAMPWPDIFFKKRKSNPLPEPTTTTSAAGAGAEKKREKEDSEAAEKADSLRALTESGSTPVAPRAAKESPLAGSLEASPNPADVKTSRIDVPPQRSDPPGATRSGAVSLRQRAKLTDDALVPPKSEDKLPEPVEKTASTEPAKKPGEETGPETKTTPAAVVPAAFPVAVETGSVLEKPADPKNEIAPPPEPKPVEIKSSESKPSEDKTSGPGSEPGKMEGADAVPRDTTRVRLGDTTPPSTAIKPAEPSSDTRKKQEFILANGERILGHVLSETPQTIYIDHGALGVLTLPRSQIASKPIEVILINGDRIVGDLIAETPECLYVKHASLGMLTVPHSQRSTRVVEAIMKDGDRILGEVLAETENFTVIRSATLGTVAVQHDQVAMLNRKIEQMQLRALPPALEDKAKSPM